MIDGIQEAFGCMMKVVVKVKVTISDIAKLAGVAKSTVSRYLNGGYVSEATKQKLDKIIEETKYEPNSFAQSLKAKKTNLIGVIIPRFDSYAASRTLIGIDEMLKELGYQILVANTSQKLEREIENMYSLANQKVAGIILLAKQVTEDHIKAAKAVNIPMLIVGQEHKEFHSLIYSDEQAGYDIGKYVTKCGHTNISYIGVTEEDIAVGVKRKEGFMKAVKEEDTANVSYYESGFSIEGAYEVALSIIEEKPPTILVCATDNIALGTVKAIHELNLKIPEDISVTGFGDYDVADIVHPSLTTVHYPYKTSGATAAKKIVQMIQREDVERLMVIPCQLVERKSVRKK